tara:strand:+ start:536 stop:1594 length:1059 start_codon:yes stop_codon:yes gene_type:complete
MLINNILKHNKDSILCKTFKDYKVYNYNKYVINNDNIDTLGLFRSIIFKNNKCVCMSPCKSQELNYFIKHNPKYNIEEYIDGLMINCFWDSGEWHIATYNMVDHNETSELFIKHFDTNNWDKLNKQYNYSFVFQHTSLPIINNKVIKIYLIDIFDPIKICSVKTSCLKAVLNNVHTPQKICLTLDEAIKKYCFIDSEYTFKGLVLVNNNKRTKIRNSAFEYYKYIHGNNSLSIMFEFCYMYKNKTLNNYILKYGKDTLSLIKKIYYNTTYNIYISYRNIYIRKTDSINNYADTKQKILLQLHKKYINELMPNKKYITKKYVIEYINNMSSYELFILISDIRIFYKYLNKLRI